MATEDSLCPKCGQVLVRVDPHNLYCPRCELWNPHEWHRPTAYEPLDQGHGGADFSLVVLDQNSKPSCRLHGAMNKVSPSSAGGLWRCLNGKCRAGCKERHE